MAPTPAKPAVSSMITRLGSGGSGGGWAPSACPSKLIVALVANGLRRRVSAPAPPFSVKVPSDPSDVISKVLNALPESIRTDSNAYWCGTVVVPASSCTATTVPPPNS